MIGPSLPTRGSKVRSSFTPREDAAQFPLRHLLGADAIPRWGAFQIAATNGLSVANYVPPIKLALAAGLMVIGGTDSTRIGEFNTWRAIEYRVTGRPVGRSVQTTNDAGVSRLEALRLYTANAAWISFDEAKRGTLEPGKAADLAVLDHSYLDMPAEQIHTIQSVLTMTGGKVVHASDPFSSANKMSRWPRDQQALLSDDGPRHHIESEPGRGSTFTI